MSAGSGSEFTLETENVTPDTQSWKGVSKELWTCYLGAGILEEVTLEPVDM